MAMTIAAERRLLAESELDPVMKSHYPALHEATHEQLVALARWLRGQRGRAGDIIRDRRRARRGKASGDGATSERGLAAKKQIFAHALRRVNARIDYLAAKARRATATARLKEALARRRQKRVHHPQGDATSGGGMQPNDNRKGRRHVTGSRIGSVSKAGRRAQARRDARPG